MSNRRDVAPDGTAVRVALWRALHVEVDSAPHVLKDGVGLKLLVPDERYFASPGGPMVCARQAMPRNCRSPAYR